MVLLGLPIAKVCTQTKHFHNFTQQYNVLEEKFIYLLNIYGMKNATTNHLLILKCKNQSEKSLKSCGNFSNGGHKVFEPWEVLSGPFFMLLFLSAVCRY